MNGKKIRSIAICQCNYGYFYWFTNLLYL